MGNNRSDTAATQNSAPNQFMAWTMQRAIGMINWTPSAAPPLDQAPFVSMVP